MSKIVRTGVKVISKVVKGIGKAVKKVMKSKIGRMIVMAAGAYFLGPMASSFMQSFGAASSAGSGFLASLGEGLSAAGTAFSTQASSLASSVGSIFGGQSAAIGGGAADVSSGYAMDAVAADATQAGASLGGGAADVASGYGMDAIANGATQAGGAIGDAAGYASDIASSTAQSTGGVINSAMGDSGASLANLDQIPSVGGQSVAKMAENAATQAGGKSGWREILSKGVEWVEKNPRAAAAAIQVGGGLVGGVMQDVSAKNARDRELSRMYDNWKGVGNFRVGPDGRLYA